MADSEWWKRDDETQYGDWQELTTDDGLTYYYNSATNETSWEKPEELLSDGERAHNSAWVWYFNQEEMEYLPALNRGVQGDDVVLELQDGQEVRVSQNADLEPLQKQSLQRTVADLTLLPQMSTPLILYCLQRRFEKAKIYTAIGGIIISMNPYTLIENLYGKRVILKYRSALEDHRKIEPHVYVPAHEAFTGLTFENGRNQSIIISGESGAGKTEAAKQCLSYIGAVAGSLSGIEKKVFQSNPILEAFGNAKTIRNNNSSRFGKYVDIAFEQNLQIVGATTTNYLLEKIRVVAPQEGERNYHIFYFLAGGADRSLKETLGLTRPGDYNLCTMGGETTIPGMSDPKEFAEVQEAFHILDFSQAEIDNVYRVVAAIMHLGNVPFSEEKRGFQDPVAIIDDMYGIEWAASLLEVDAEQMAQALKTQVIIDSAKELSRQGAMDQRDNFCKFVYSKMFDWLVEMINRSMVPAVAVKKRIGILDIFGFEIFKVNSLEQLCINYCNEKLQNLFNRTVFELEARIYQQEGINVGEVEYIDNKPILDLIDQKRPMGILVTLDEELRKPGGNIQKYKGAIDQNFASHNNYRRGRGNMHFILTHYAGDVTYDVTEFMEKNKDALSKDLSDLASQCGNALMKQMFGRSQGQSSRSRKATLCKQFTNQLGSLMKTLDTTQPHYIRCIKPNNDKAPLYFVSRNCLEQLTYSGVFEAVKIRKNGYPYRLKHNDFVNRYKCIMEEDKVRCGTGVNGCKTIMRHLNLNPENCKVGRTMMLYRASEHSLMELKQSIIQEKRRMADTLSDILGTNWQNMGEDEKIVFFQRVGQAVRSCNRFKIHTPAAEETRELLEVFIMERMDPNTRQLLEEALETRDLALLEEVCEIIEENDYQTNKCQLAVKLRDRILRVYEECRNAMESLEIEHMRAVCQAANEVGYNNDAIDQFYQLFAYGDENSDAFQKEHLKMIYVNVQNGVEGAFARAMAVEIKLKERIFGNPMFASQFDIMNFPGLKDPDDWAGESWNLFKGNLKDTMMVYTKDKIHTHLTQVGSEFKKVCVTNFENVQMYCSDRAVPNNGNAEEYGLKVLTLGFTEPIVRDEIYCQIMKQLRSNENSYSIGQCWKLLNLCLYTFGPSDKLENYITMFIREYGGDQRDSTLRNLQTTLYNNDSLLPAPPTLNDMRDIAQGARARYNFLEEPPAAPTWTDLLEAFDENNPYDNNAPLPGAVAAKPKKQLEVRTAARSRMASSAQPKPPAFGGMGGPPVGPGQSPPTQSQSNGGGPPPPGPGQKAVVPPSRAPIPPVAPGKAQAPETYVWIAHLDADSGDLYYFNEQTEETQWNRPRESIKPFFVARLDEGSGQFYFEDLVGGETMWDAPEEYCDENEAWTAHMDKDSGDYYFENMETSEVQWDKPPSLTPKTVEEWTRHFDNRTKKYYYQNMVTDHVTWDCPPGFQA